MHLHIGYKNYSSWSLRPWLVMRHFDIAFTETLYAFYHDTENGLEAMGERFRIPPQVPVLEDDDHVIWDSLAIMEYLAESYPNQALWPSEKKLRALARSAAAEMHSGFMVLRSECPMNCRSQKKKVLTPAIQADLDRLKAIWEHFVTINKPAGEFLGGSFGIVDAMYAPIMWRVSGYGLSVSENFSQWTTAMKNLPAMQEWLAAAQAEEWVIEAYEAMGD